jgi:hypothetical protein
MCCIVSPAAFQDVWRHRCTRTHSPTLNSKPYTLNPKPAAALGYGCSPWCTVWWPWHWPHSPCSSSGPSAPSGPRRWRTPPTSRPSPPSSPPPPPRPPYTWLSCSPWQGGVLYATRPMDPLFNKIWVVGLRSAITLIRRCRPVGWLVVSFQLQCVSRTHF